MVIYGKYTLAVYKIVHNKSEENILYNHLCGVSFKFSSLLKIYSDVMSKQEYLAKNSIIRDLLNDKNIQKSNNINEYLNS